MAHVAPGETGDTGWKRLWPRYRYQRRRYVLYGVALTLVALAALALALMPPAQASVPGVGGISDALRVRPQYAFSFPAPGAQPLIRPISVVAGKDRVYVVDSGAGHIRVFDDRGVDRAVIGSGTLDVPVYTARDAARGILYVTDRKLATVFRFDETDGSLLGPLIPKPATEGTGSAESTAWAPLGIDVADDGTVWVSDVLARHRVLVVEPDGTIVREVGGAQAAGETTGVAVALDYPNGVSVGAEEVWVSDSNNRRVVVFGRDGAFRRVLDVDGLARGIDFVPGEYAGANDGATLVVVADALAQDIAVWDASGGVLGRFGGPGPGAGRLAFPNDVDSGADGKRLYVADTGNRRVQAWVWTDATGSRGPLGALIQSLDATGRVPYVLVAVVLVLVAGGLVVKALAPLTFVVTADVVAVMTQRGRMARLAGRGRRFVTTPAIADAAVLPASIVVEDFGIDGPDEALRALVRRHRILLTEDLEIMRDFRAGGADVFDATTFAREFNRRR